jgi:hypothetical protein
MKALITLLIIFNSLAFGQVVEGTFIAPLPSHIKLMPEDFLRPRTPKLNLLNWARTTPELGYQSWLHDFSDSKAKGLIAPIVMSPDFARMELSVLCNDYHRLGTGGFVKRLVYSFKEEASRQGRCKNAAIELRTYQQPNALGAFGPIAKYNHRKQTDPGLFTIRLATDFLKRGPKREFGADVVDLMKDLPSFKWATKSHHRH